MDIIALNLGEGGQGDFRDSDYLYSSLEETGRDIEPKWGEKTMKIRQFRTVVEFIRKEVNPEFPIQQLSVLLLVAEEEGITQTEISQILSMPQATVSRNVAKLGNKVVQRDGKSKMIGYGLVENRQDVVHDPRRLAVYLTDKGKKFIKDLSILLK